MRKKPVMIETWVLFLTQVDLQPLSGENCMKVAYKEEAHLFSVRYIKKRVLTQLVRYP